MARTKLTASVMPSTKTRLQAYCEEHNLTMGDVVETALINFFEYTDRKNSAPDLVLDRVNQILLTQMQIAQTLGEVKDKVIGFDE